jgi:hypothetical protein
MPRKICSVLTATGLFSLFAVMLSAADTVATAVYARVGNGYKRERGSDGAFKPEYYAIANGGRIAGTTSDQTVDRVTYPEVAGIAMRLLAGQNYHYARSREQAKLLVVLQWGSTIAPNGMNYSMSVNAVGAVLAAEDPQGMGSLDSGMEGVGGAGGASEDMMIRLLMENRARDRINEANARVLGYLDDINDSNDIRRWAGGGDRYNDLVADVEESRYYIVISAYDFPELLRGGKKKLLWQTRVSVRSPGNNFDDSFVPMLKSASRYFGQDSGRLVRGEEPKAVVELGDLKFLGEAKEPGISPTKQDK